ncbi:DUF4250 domain-containing protein [Haloferula sargassicola]|uniref:DUF4250 domain-containing protein n=1 Tax=Haloferula sargassicola TaxID=490096 RepID=UPI0033654080
MRLTDYQRMDPHLLVGLVNTELRNHAADLDDLTKTHGIVREKLIERLSEAGYGYREELKQFR